MVINEYIKVFFLSTLPLAELRLSIPYGLMNDLNPFLTYMAGVTGNLLPVPFLLVLLDIFKNIASKWSVTRKLMERIFDRTYEKRGLIEKYGYIGLFLFVAIPLPVTGAWTGSLLAFLLDLKKNRAFLSITAGVVLAGVIVTLLSLGVLSIRNLF
jgi:uncharacterized membrane protein